MSELRRRSGPRPTPEQQIVDLRREVKALQAALGAFISWTAQSANSPIRVDEASRLLTIMTGLDPQDGGMP